MNCFKVLIASSLLALALMPPVPLYAADDGSQSKSFRTPPGGKPSFRNLRPKTEEFKSRQLTSTPDIPGLPPYPSVAKMVSGFSQPQAPGGPGFVAQFCTRDSKDVVLNWYADAFRSNGWTLDKSMRSDRCVAALDKNGAMCQILVNELANQDMITPHKAGAATTDGAKSTKPAKCVMVWIQYKAKS